MEECEIETRSQAFAEVTEIFRIRELEAQFVAERLNEMQNRDHLIALGTAAYGTRWQAEVAAALAVSDRSVRAWVSGKTSVADAIVRDLRDIVKDRANLLRKVLSDSAPASEQTAFAQVHLEVRGKTLSRVVSVHDLKRSNGTDGDLIEATVRVATPLTPEFIELPFGEEVADGLFVGLNSHYRTWLRDDWARILGSRAAADVAFEAAKGLIREFHPEYVAIEQHGGMIEFLEEHGFKVIGRDPKMHFHWRIRHVESGTSEWFPSIRAAVRNYVD